MDDKKTQADIANSIKREANHARIAEEKRKRDENSKNRRDNKRDSDSGVKRQAELIDNIKREGELTRSGDDDSLRSVSVGVEKFGEVFASMREAITRQSSTLMDIAASGFSMLKITEDAEERTRLRDELGRAERTDTSEQRGGSGSSGDGSGSGAPAAAQMGFLQTLLTTLGPGFGGFIGAALGGAASLLSVRAIGGLLLRAIPLAVLAPYIGNFVSTIVEVGLRDAGASPEFIASISNPVNRAAIGGALGLVFGARGAAVGAMAGLFSSFGENMLASLGLTDGDISDETWRILGVDFNASTVTQAMSGALGGALILLAPALLRLSGGLLLAALTGPVGLAALTGAALVGSVVLVEGWLERRQNAFIAELEERTAAGFAGLDAVQNDQAPGVLRRTALGIGLSRAGNAAEELEVFRQTVSGSLEAITPDTPVEMGGQFEFKIPEGEILESLRESFSNILGENPNLQRLSESAFEDIAFSAEELRVQSVIDLVNTERERRSLFEGVSETYERIRDLEERRTDYIQEIGMDNTSFTRNVDSALAEQRRFLATLSTDIAALRGSTEARSVFSQVIPEVEPAFIFQPSMMGGVNPTEVLSILEDALLSQSDVAPIIVTSAPTIAPVQNTVRGATTYNNQRITSIGAGHGRGSGMAGFAN